MNALGQAISGVSPFVLTGTAVAAGDSQPKFKDVNLWLSESV